MIKINNDDGRFIYSFLNMQQTKPDHRENTLRRLINVCPWALTVTEKDEEGKNILP